MKNRIDRAVRAALSLFVAVCLVLSGVPATAEEPSATEGALLVEEPDSHAATTGSAPAADNTDDGGPASVPEDDELVMLDEELAGEDAEQPAADPQPGPQPDEELADSEDAAEPQATEAEPQPQATAAEDPEAAEPVDAMDEQALVALCAEAEGGAALDAEAARPVVEVLPYMQGSGWASAWSKNGATAGGAGKGRRLEALRIRLASATGSIRYRAHVQNEGWQDWVTDGGVSGRVGKGRRIEALQIKLGGRVAKGYDLWYRVYSQDMGWMGWAKNGATVGTAGKNLRVEAIQVTLRAKGSKAPAATKQGTKRAFVGTEEIRLAAYVQKRGWVAEVGNGRVAGTTGKGLRVEALRASLSGLRVPGNVKTSVHVQKTGWTGWKVGPSVAGTTGKSLRVEAFRMRLTGEAARVYDLYYRAHVKGVGWLSWAKEGEVAGSEHLALQVEAVQAKLVKAGGKAPSNKGAAWRKPSLGTSAISYTTYGHGSWQKAVRNGRTSGKTGKRIPLQGLRIALSGGSNGLGGTVSYRVYMQGSGWQKWRKNNKIAGRPGAGKRMEAIQVKISGKAAKVYDVWYRVHVQGFGWLGWAKNGGSAGTEGLSRRVEAVQIRLVPKKAAAPGSTSRAFVDWALGRSLNAAKNTRAVTAFGGHRSSDGVIRRITGAIADIRNQGYDVGFIMMDISSRKGIAYNCDALFYSASSIKGPYLASVVSAHPDAIRAQEYNITQTLFYSYDETYKAVLAAYGKEPMRTYCREAGVNVGVAEQLPWVTYSARDLAKFWARNYLLFSQSPEGEQFGRWCERPNVSTIHSTLSGTYRTRSKAGWTNFGGERYPNINGGGPLWDVAVDGGIVYARNGDYVMAIVSSAVGNHSMLHPLTAAINAAHEEM